MIITMIMIMMVTIPSLFGSGHEVRAEVPGQTRVEYNIGYGQPLTVGFSSSGFPEMLDIPRY